MLLGQCLVLLALAGDALDTRGQARDLVLEAQYHGLGPQMELLQAHRIPTSERTLPLHKDAPREIEPRTLLSSCLGSCRRRGGPQA